MFFQVDCKPITLCFLGCVQQKKTLMVGLRDILSEPVSKREDLADPVADQAIQPTQYSDQLPVADQDLTDPVADQAIENPFTLTDAEVAEVLRGLEETFTAAEVEELLGGLGETSTTDGSDGDGTLQGHHIDNEMDGVLNMCIEDYIV